MVIQLGHGEVQINVNGIKPKTVAHAARAPQFLVLYLISPSDLAIG